jgi:hypothetical protein
MKRCDQIHSLLSFTAMMPNGDMSRTYQTDIMHEIIIYEYDHVMRNNVIWSPSNDQMDMGEGNRFKSLCKIVVQTVHSANIGSFHKSVYPGW